MYFSYNLPARVRAPLRATFFCTFLHFFDISWCVMIKFSIFIFLVVCAHCAVVQENALQSREPVDVSLVFCVCNSLPLLLYRSYLSGILRGILNILWNIILQLKVHTFVWSWAERVVLYVCSRKKGEGLTRRIWKQSVLET